jgi:hypothetical protein
VLSLVVFSFELRMCASRKLLRVPNSARQDYSQNFFHLLFLASFARVPFRALTFCFDGRLADTASFMPPFSGSLLAKHTRSSDVSLGSEIARALLRL